MAKVDLITGLRGAGKTIFATIYMKHLQAKGLHPFNARANFGNFDADGFLECTDPDGWKLEEMDNSPRRILAALPRAAKGYDHVVLECNRMLTRPEYQSLFDAPELIAYEPGAVIAVLRSQEYGRLRAVALRPLIGILESASVVLFNNVEVTPQEVKAARQEISMMMRKWMESEIWEETMQNRILETPWSRLGDMELEQIRKSSPIFFGDLLPEDCGTVGETMFYPSREYTKEELERLLNEIAGGSCGNVMRIRGRLNCEGGSLIIDWTESQRSISKSREREKPGIAVVGRYLSHVRINEILR